MPDERQLGAWLPEPGLAIVAVGTQENGVPSQGGEGEAAQRG